MSNPQLNSQYSVKWTIARAERDLENSSFLSAQDCVSVANTILHLKLTGKLQFDLGFNESLMLVSSTKREVRLAFLLLMDLYYTAGRKNFTQVLFNDLYAKCTDNLEKMLLLNTMVAAKRSTDVQPRKRSLIVVQPFRSPLGPSSSKGAPALFEMTCKNAIARSPIQRPCPEILNRLLVYLAHSGGLTDECLKSLAFDSSLATITCTTLCQLLKPLVRTNDGQYTHLIKPLMLRMLQCINNSESIHLGLPDPWFLTNGLKLLRSFYPTRFIARESTGSPSIDRNFSYFNEMPKATSRLHRSASLILNITARRHHYSRRNSEVQVNPTLNRDGTYQDNNRTQPLTTLLGDLLTRIFELETARSFSPVQFRHHRNLHTMIKAEACRLIYALQPSDLWLTKATEETVRQFQSVGTNTVRNAISTWDVAATDHSILQCQPRILSELLGKLTQMELQSTLKLRIAQLLVKIAIHDINLNGCTRLNIEPEDYENTRGYDLNFLEHQGARRNLVSPHTVINSLLLTMHRRDPYPIKLGLTQCICETVKASKFIEEDAFVPMIFEILSVCPDAWKPLIPLIKGERILALKLLEAGEAHILDAAASKDITLAAKNLSSFQLTVYLMGHLHRCSVHYELLKLLDPRSKGIEDTRAICLALNSARILYHSSGENDREKLKAIMSMFLRHDDLNIQAVATESWLTLRSGFPVCASEDRN